MTVPRGSIWEGAKNDALETISDGVVKDLSRALSFYEWRENGGYHVTGSTKKDFLISCSTNEYAGMIAREVATLLDQALEHRLLIAEAYQSTKSPSQSWLLVTTYYWCVFLALAWLRMVGKVVTYLPSKELERLRKLGNSAHKCPANGTFVVSITGIEGARSNLQYRRLNSNNFHDGLWTTFYADIQQRLQAASKDPATWETRLYSALNFRSRSDLTGWPSKLRNAINYRVGFGYGSVNGNRVPDIFPTLELVKSANVQTLVQHLEEAQRKTAGRSVIELPAQYGNMMILFGATATHLLEDYCADIWQQRGIDPLWSQRRNKYTKSFGQAVDTLWPM